MNALVPDEDSRVCASKVALDTEKWTFSGMLALVHSETAAACTSKIAFVASE